MQGHFGTPDMQFDLVSGLHERITSFGLKSIIPSIFTCVGKLIIQFCPKSFHKSVFVAPNILKT